MSEIIRAWLKNMDADDRALWTAVAENVEVKDFARDGKRMIRLTHRPTGKQITRVSGASMHESYANAFKDLMELLS
jgi:hypothetical protein